MVDNQVILLVDDDPRILEAMSVLFMDVDCEVITANNGQEALYLAVEARPSIIISDYQMPLLNGIDLYNQMKQSPLTSHIPFIFLTSKDDLDFRISLFEDGITDYWQKPFNPREVRAKLVNLLKKQAQSSPTQRLITEIAAPTGAYLSPIIYNRYEIVEQIAKGGMSYIYKAKNLLNGESVAIKIIKSSLVENDVAMKRFAREAAVAMRLNHPNLVNTYEYGLLPSGQAYIVMELLQGRSLGDQLFDHDLLDLNSIIDIMYQISLAVCELHYNGIIHRDIKPENFFLIEGDDHSLNVKMLDFGIVIDTIKNRERLTQEEFVVGTPIYFAPEQATKQEITFATDIYSLGILFYELLTGQLPFEGHTTMDFVLQHLTQDIPHIVTRFGSLPDIESLITEMVKKSPETRPNIDFVVQRLAATL